MVTAGSPYYAPLADMDFARARREVDEHLWLTFHVAREAVGRVRPGGTLLFMSGTGGRRPAFGLALTVTLTAAMPASSPASRSSWRRCGSTSSPPEPRTPSPTSSYTTTRHVTAASRSPLAAVACGNGHERPETADRFCDGPAR
jgi:hypothetical protein